MRLEAGGYRELHWHVASEWSLVLNGSCRVQVMRFPWLPVYSLITKLTSVARRLMKMARLSLMTSTLVMSGSSHRESEFPVFFSTLIRYTWTLTFDRGIPHSIQALDGGVEFLLVFDDGALVKIIRSLPPKSSCTVRYDIYVVFFPMLGIALISSIERSSCPRLGYHDPRSG